MPSTSPQPPAKYYRPDIDGLRAVAVLAVLGYHAYPYLVPGGFAGVDVFFVISGYLITLILLRDLQADRFSLGEFYARRVRRIFPALLVVLIAVIFVGWLTLLESQFKFVGRHTAAGAAFVSNLVFWQESDYFDHDADEKPLLHLWSLGIEEQFYIVWPVLIFVAWKRRWNLRWILLTVIAVSFAASVKSLYEEPKSSFYLPLQRAWELALGGLLAMANRLPARVSKNVVSGAGLICLIASFFLLNSNIPYPGVRALLPTIGTALLIAAGPQAWLNRHVLSNRALVACGLISFSLYLWHWPLLSLDRLLRGDKTPYSERAFLLLASVALATLSYWIVERPVRLGGHFRLKTAALCLVMAITGCVGWAASGGMLLARSSAYGTERIEAAVRDTNFPVPGMERVNFQKSRFYRTPGDSSGRFVWYIGDSHMQQYGARIEQLAENAHGTLPRAVFSTKAGCAPLAGFRSPQWPCDDYIADTMAYGKDPGIAAIVIAAAWQRYFVDEGYTYHGADEPYTALEKLLTGFVKSGKKVFLVLQIPMGRAAAPEATLHRNFDLLHGRIDFQMAGNILKTADIEHTIGPMRARLQEACRRAGAEVIDPLEYLCHDGACPSAGPDGEPRYKDGFHLRGKFVREQVTYLDHTLSR